MQHLGTMNLSFAENDASQCSKILESRQHSSLAADGLDVWHYVFSGPHRSQNRWPSEAATLPKETPYFAGCTS